MLKENHLALELGQELVVLKQLVTNRHQSTQRRGFGGEGDLEIKTMKCTVMLSKMVFFCFEELAGLLMFNTIWFAWNIQSQSDRKIFCFLVSSIGIY